jgi:hypothetical protein
MALLSVVDGWPHQTMLSVGEVVVVDEHDLALALWPGSRTSRAIEESGRATLTAIVPPRSYSLRLELRRAPDIEVSSGGARACFFATVLSAAVDEAPYATLESGVSFSLKDTASTLERWRTTRTALADAWRTRCTHE